jgi:hypothetical protein
MKNVIRLLAIIGLLLGINIGSSAADMRSVFESPKSTATMPGKVVFDRDIEGSKFVAIKSGKTTYVQYMLATDVNLYSIDPVSGGSCITLRKDKRRTIVFFPIPFPDNKDESVEWVQLEEADFKKLIEALKP